MRDDLDMARSDNERLLQQAILNVGAKTRRSRPRFWNQPARHYDQDGDAASFMERMMVVHALTMDTKHTAGIFVEEDSDAIDYKLQLPSNPLIEQQSDMRTGINREFADLGVVTKSDVEAIAENSGPKLTYMLELQSFKAAESKL